MDDFNQSQSNWFLDFLQSIAVSLALFSVVYLFLFRPSVVQGSSMQPSLATGQRLVTDEVSYQFHNPERGDIVTLHSPTEPQIQLIKRIIGLPGESIKIQDGVVYIDNDLLQEPYLNSSTSASVGRFLSDGQSYQIPADHYFVMGDNRQHSADSRTFGSVPRSLIIGKAILRYWPAEKFGILPH